MIAHYEKIADNVSVPMILYSVPSRTGVNISPSVVKVLSRHPGIAGIKEASGNMGQVCAMAQYICDDFQIYAGNDDLAVPFLPQRARQEVQPSVRRLQPRLYRSP